MAYYFGNLPPYVLNRKGAKRTADGKYKYRYPLNNGAVTVAVSEEVYRVMEEFDRAEYNNDRKEIRHRGEAPAYQDDCEYEETNALENLADERTYGMQEDICEHLDRDAVLAKLSETDRRIYRLCIEKDYIQTKAAEILKINQATVARRLTVVYDLIETERLNDGTRTAEEIKFDKTWLEFLRTGKTKNDDDVFLEHIIFSFYSNDLRLFLYWFYSFKELCRYILKYFILRENCFQEDIDGYLKIASEKGKKHFNEHYKNQPELIQCVYVNMITEAWRRVKNSHGAPFGIAYYAIDAKRDKIIKKLKTTEDEFLRNRFFSFIASKRRKRQEEFIKKYKR